MSSEGCEFELVREYIELYESELCDAMITSS